MTPQSETGSRWKQRWASFAAEVRRWGVPRVLYSRLMRSLSPVLQVSFATVRPLGNLEARTSHAGCEIRLANRDELWLASEDPTMQLERVDVDAALARGDICVAAFDGNRMVAYAWRAFGMTPHRGRLWVRFKPPCRYGYKAYTRPEFRGARLQESISPVTDSLCREKGYTHGISFIDTHNYASLSSARRVGSRIVGLIGYVNLYGRIVTFSTRGARAYGFGFFLRE